MELMLRGVFQSVRTQEGENRGQEPQSPFVEAPAELE
jgi:hypothetical protein